MIEYTLNIILMYLGTVVSFIWVNKGYIIMVCFIAWFIESINRIKRENQEILNQLFLIENLLNDD